MFEAIKIFLLVLYFTFIYLLTDSLLLALITIPIFSYLEIIKQDYRDAKKTLVILFFAFLVPTTVYFYFSFLPGRLDSSVPISELALNSVLLGLFGSFLVGLRRLSDYFQVRRQYKTWNKKHRELTALAGVLILLPLLVWAHIQYKVSQEKAFDKQAEALLSLLHTAQKASLVEFHSYQKDLEALGFPPKGDGFVIYLDGENLPFEYTDLLNEDTKPFVSKDQYRALLALKNPHSHTFKFFVGDSTGQIQQLKKQLPLK